MATSTELFAHHAPSTDQDERLVIHGVSWETYCAVRDALDDIPGLRLTYLEGALELMSPSGEHESIKKRIARLVETYALERDVPLYGYGSTTFRKQAKERGLEPDECYCLGAELLDYPDIAIEVALTSGGLPKLRVYEGLGVREVWFWIEDRFSIHLLGPGGYASSPKSALIPSLDFDLLAEFVRRRDQPGAVRDYRDALRAAAHP
jgi:Uma2 family endonuclease